MLPVASYFIVAAINGQNNGVQINLIVSQSTYSILYRKPVIRRKKPEKLMS